MLTIQIHDEQLARALQQIAEQENRPVEDVLRELLAQYPGQRPAENSGSSEDDVVRHVRRKAYSKARLYWQSVGDAAKAALSDERLDAEFATFDEEGIPRLKSELVSLEPPAGSLAYAAKMAREANIHTGNPLDATLASDILNEEFSDYLHHQLRGPDGAQ